MSYLRDEFEKVLSEAVPLENAVAEQIAKDRTVFPLVDTKLYSPDELRTACTGPKGLFRNRPEYQTVSKKLYEHPLPITGENFWKIVDSVLYNYERSKGQNANSKAA